MQKMTNGGEQHLVEIPEGFPDFQAISEEPPQELQSLHLPEELFVIAPEDLGKYFIQHCLDAS